MSLRLIPSKSWNPYSTQARERVARDEQADRRRRERKRQNEDEALFNVLRARGRKRAGMIDRDTDWMFLSKKAAMGTEKYCDNCQVNSGGHRNQCASSEGNEADDCGDRGGVAGGSRSSGSVVKRRRVQAESTGYMFREFQRKQAADPMLKVAIAKSEAKRRLVCAREQQYGSSDVSLSKMDPASDSPDNILQTRLDVPFWGGFPNSASMLDNVCLKHSREEKLRLKNSRKNEIQKLKKVLNQEKTKKVSLKERKEIKKRNRQSTETRRELKRERRERGKEKKEKTKKKEKKKKTKKKEKKK